MQTGRRRLLCGSTLRKTVLTLSQSALRNMHHETWIESTKPLSPVIITRRCTGMRLVFSMQYFRMLRLSSMPLKVLWYTAAQLQAQYAIDKHQTPYMHHLSLAPLRIPKSNGGGPMPAVVSTNAKWV